jgi:hypothetical protein
MEGKVISSSRDWLDSSSFTNDYVFPSHQIASSLTIDKIGGDMYMFLPNDKASSAVSFNGKNGNTAIRFDSSINAMPNILIKLSSEDAVSIDDRFFENSIIKQQEIILIRDISDDICDSLGEPGNPINPVFAFYKGVYWMHDPRFVRITYFAIVI